METKSQWTLLTVWPTKSPTGRRLRATPVDAKKRVCQMYEVTVQSKLCKLACRLDGLMAFRGDM